MQSPNLDESTLQVTEIYRSIQGEAAYSGWPCTFVRLTGCPLRCRWCDTAYSFEGGTTQSISAILSAVDGLGVRTVEITGGEPLAQANCLALIDALIVRKYQVLIETSGSESIGEINKSAHIIMDLKCPTSKMSDRNDYSNIRHLKPSDEVKFVIASKEDFEWALKTVGDYDLEKRCQILFSPAFGLVVPKDLTEWLLGSGVNARLNLQIHKYIWSPRAKGV